MLRNHVGSRTQHKVEGIGKNNLGTDITQFFRQHCFNRGAGADGHKCGCSHTTTRHFQYPVAGESVSVSNCKVHICRMWLKITGICSGMIPIVFVNHPGLFFLSSNEHRITVTVESVSLPDGMVISGKYPMLAGKSAYQHKQGGFRHVEVGDHGIDR